MKKSIGLLFLLLASSAVFEAQAELPLVARATLPRYVCVLGDAKPYLAKQGAEKKKLDLKKVRKELTGKLAKIRTAASKLSRSLKALNRQKAKNGKKIIAAKAKLLALGEQKAQIAKTLKAVASCPKSTFANLPSDVPSVIETAEFQMPAGQTMELKNDLTIRATGDVVIDGTIMPQNLNGQNLLIESEGNVTVGGTLIAGSTEAEEESSGVGSSAAESASDGGSVGIRGKNITIGSTASIVAGNAGKGGGALAIVTAKARAATRGASGPLIATGGDGGTGGSVFLDAGEGTLRIDPSPDGRPIIILGNGGNGGDATATTVGNESSVTELQASAGRGGDSGFPVLNFKTLEGLTFTTTTTANRVVQDNFVSLAAGGTLISLDEASTKVFAGGSGGDAGKSLNGVPIEEVAPLLLKVGLLEEAILVDEPSSLRAETSCPASGGTPGRSCKPPAPAAGGNGFFCPGNGEDQTCNDPLKDGTGTAAGGSAEVMGGDGGNLRMLLAISTKLITGAGELGIGVTISSVPSADGKCGKGGNGGSAFARAGKGGPVGGNGGGAKATGGRGGNAAFSTNFGDLPVTITLGGNGGRADVIAGNASAGASCCPQNPGQMGGTGGDAIAKGGGGGNGVILNYGGSANAVSGAAGNGGDGIPPAFPGQVGEARAEIGANGDGNFDPPGAMTKFKNFPNRFGTIPSKSATEGKVGVKGIDCNATPTPTPTPTRTPEPRFCQDGSYKVMNVVDNLCGTNSPLCPQVIAMAPATKLNVTFDPKIFTDIGNSSIHNNQMKINNLDILCRAANDQGSPLTQCPANAGFYPSAGEQFAIAAEIYGGSLGKYVCTFLCDPRRTFPDQFVLTCNAVCPPQEPSQSRLSYTCQPDPQQSFTGHTVYLQMVKE